MTELRDYVRKNRYARACVTCSLPPDLLKAVRQGRREGISFPLISGFLRERGHGIKPGTLKAHFEAHER